MTEKAVHPYHHIPLDRVSVLIDSIYAFAMTLLVTTISVPPKYTHSPGINPVQSILTSVFPDLIHYFIAFILLAIFWYFEHQRFRSLKYLDRPLLCMNIASLAFVCLIPFSTNIAGDYPFDNLGAIIFELNVFIIGLIASIQWMYMRGRRVEFVPDLSEAHIAREIRWARVFPLLAVAGILCAYFQIVWSPVVFLLAPFIMAFLYWNDPVIPGKTDREP